MHRFMLFCILIAALVLSTKGVPNRTVAAQLPSKTNSTHRSQPRIGVNERSHLMAVSAQNPVPELIAPDVIDFSVADYGAVYVKNTGEISTTFVYNQVKISRMLRE